jgi:hypothetical protein
MCFGRSALLFVRSWYVITFNKLTFVQKETQSNKHTIGVEHVGDVEAIFSCDYKFGEGTKKRYNANLGRSVHRLSIENEVVFGNKGDNLTFRSLIDGKEVSNSVIRFDH